MNTHTDPMIGEALDLLVPRVEFDPETLVAGARTRAETLRRGRRRRLTAGAIAFAALLLFVGAAIAADRLGLLGFLHTNDRNSARFSVDPSRTYRGPAAFALTCPDARNGAFVCTVTHSSTSGTRTYQRAMRVPKAPAMTRQQMLDALTRAEANGADPAEIARVRNDLGQVGDDFIHALAILSRIQEVGGGSGSSGPPGTESVPPRGVPAWAACRALTAATYRCRPLAGFAGVPSGTPLYSLLASSDWRSVPVPTRGRSDVFKILEAVLGRKPTAAETRLLIDVVTVVGTGSSSGPPPPTSTTITVP